MQRQSSVAYVVAGSAIIVMERLIRDHESPLFLQFRPLELHPLTTEDTQALVEKVVDGTLTPAVHAAIFAYTYGHPFYVTALGERLREMAADPATTTPEQAGHAFLLEALEEENLSLTETAHRLHRRPAAVQGYLRWLREVDLLTEQDKRYSYRDPVLRFWVAQTTVGTELHGFPRREDLDALLSDLSERFQRTATQLGRAKENEVRELR